jgi:tRNA-dihydrouridine synthase B
MYMHYCVRCPICCHPLSSANRIALSSCGCPIDSIVNQGKGSGLMQRPRRLEAVLRAMVVASPRVPITMKMRVGFHDDRLVAADYIPFIRRAGVAAMTVRWNFIFCSC